MSDQVQILLGDCLEKLRTLPEKSVHCCVTSPPYWGLRDYGVAGQIGLEKTPQEYVAKMVEVFAGVWRVLRDDGTVWLNLGDCYCSTAPGSFGDPLFRRGPFEKVSEQCAAARRRYRQKTPNGLKPKDLVGIPWRVAFALQEAGWYLRQDIIWAKPNPMPESVIDRCTKAHEYIFLLSKSQRYYYDREAIMEACSDGTHPRLPGNVRPAKGAQAYLDGDSRQRTKLGLLNHAQRMRKSWRGSEFHDGKNLLVHPNVGKVRPKNNDSFNEAMAVMPETRNKRSVWTVSSQPYSEAHFATFPPALIKPCILAGCPVGGTVLDPFGGSGTTGMVALELGRKAILIELNPAYVGLAADRTNVTPGLPL